VDTTPDKNTGMGATNGFRITEGVDIEEDVRTGSNYLITDTENGEWLAYTVDVQQAGYYNLSLGVVASEQGVSRIDLIINDKETIPFSRIISSDSSYYLTKIQEGIYLEKGEQTFKILVASSSIDLKLDKLVVTPLPATSVQELAESPSGFLLGQNYPNPFNPSTTIPFQIATPGIIELKIYSLNGIEVYSMVRSYTEPGNHQLTFRSETLPSGMYIYRLSHSDGHSFSRKMILLK
jgi:hypothetical protein